MVDDCTRYPRPGSTKTGLIPAPSTKHEIDMRREIPELVQRKFLKQEAPPMLGTLMRVSCEINNLLDENYLEDHDVEALKDLLMQVERAIEGAKL